MLKNIHVISWYQGEEMEVELEFSNSKSKVCLFDREEIIALRDFFDEILEKTEQSKNHLEFFEKPLDKSN